MTTHYKRTNKPIDYALVNVKIDEEVAQLLTAISKQHKGSKAYWMRELARWVLLRTSYSNTSSADSDQNVLNIDHIANEIKATSPAQFRSSNGDKQ